MTMLVQTPPSLETMVREACIQDLDTVVSLKRHFWHGTRRPLCREFIILPDDVKKIPEELQDPHRLKSHFQLSPSMDHYKVYEVLRATLREEAAKRHLLIDTRAGMQLCLRHVHDERRGEDFDYIFFRVVRPPAPVS